jgi:hypothetical protein
VKKKKGSSISVSRLWEERNKGKEGRKEGRKRGKVVFAEKCH